MDGSGQVIQPIPLSSGRHLCILCIPSEPNRFGGLLEAKTTGRQPQARLVVLHRASTMTYNVVKARGQASRSVLRVVVHEGQPPLGIKAHQCLRLLIVNSQANQSVPGARMAAMSWLAS